MKLSYNLMPLSLQNMRPVALASERAGLHSVAIADAATDGCRVNGFVTAVITFKDFVSRRHSAHDISHSRDINGESATATECKPARSLASATGRMF
jgi:hypothetical protein